MMSAKINTISTDIERVARMAGSIILSKEDDVAVGQKTSDKDLVTEYDTRIQEMCISELSAKYPEASFYAEENCSTCSLDEEMVFIIDPIDGTSNFVSGLNYSAVSIACMIRSEIVAGVVYDPYSDEMFSAVKGGGSYLNGNPIKVSDRSLEGLLVIFGTSPYDTDQKGETFRTANRLFEKSLDVRRLGASSLDICQVAAGRAGLYYEAKLSLWDYAAAGLILTEAGGILTNMEGLAVSCKGEKTSVIAGTERTLRESEIIRGRDEH